MLRSLTRDQFMATFVEPVHGLSGDEPYAGPSIGSYVRTCVEQLPLPIPVRRKFGFCSRCERRQSGSRAERATWRTYLASNADGSWATKDVAMAKTVYEIDARLRCATLGCALYNRFAGKSRRGEQIARIVLAWRLTRG